MGPRRSIVIVTAGLLLAAGPAMAQGSPSADSIINSLRPGTGMGTGTRGIRPVTPSEAPGPGSIAPAPSGPRPASMATQAARPGAASVPPARTPVAAAPSVNLTVQFATNSAELTPAALRTLDELGRALSSQALSGYKFRIEGHTDSVGNPDHNRVLSEQRAAKVVEYLTGKFGVDRAKVEAVGMGPDQPLVRARANAPEPRNRRVTVVNVGT